MRNKSVGARALGLGVVLAAAVIGLSGTAIAQVPFFIFPPKPLFQVMPFGAGPLSQPLLIVLNGIPVGLTSESVDQPWLRIGDNNAGSFTLILDPAGQGLAAGTYTGTVTANTTAGVTSFKVNLEYGVFQPFSCISNGSVSFPARAEGLSELAGDLVALCQSGVVTPAGQPVPAYDITITLNTSVTSRLLADPWSEALLMVDEPSPQMRRFCGTPGDTQISPGVCSITGTGTGAGTYSGSSGRPNIFQGRQTGPNTITWSGVPLDPTGQPSLTPTSAPTVRILRFTNIRADANALGLAPSNATPTQVIETLAFSPPLPFPFGFDGTSSQTVAFIQQGVSASLSAPQSLSQCSSQNQALADDPSKSGISQFNVSFSEQFATAFRKRNTATSAAAPNALGNQDKLPSDIGFAPYNTETGFYNNSFPAFPGRGNLALAGLADEGSRLMVNFRNVPTGVSLFTQVSPPVTNAPDVLRLTPTDAAGGGPFSPVTGNPSGLAPIPLVGGSGIAVFESVESDPNTFATVNVPIYVAYDSTAGLPALGAATISATIGPVSSMVNADASSPLPRFINPLSPSGQTAFTINACTCASDMSARASVTRGGFAFSFGTGRFQQKITLQNIGSNFIAGPISVALDNLSGNATLANATGATNCAGPASSPYINLDLGSGLAPGAAVSVVLQFTRTGSAGITYNTRVLGGSGGR
jgi:hypothetical protein